MPAGNKGVSLCLQVFFITARKTIFFGDSHDLTIPAHMEDAVFNFYLLKKIKFCSLYLSLIVVDRI